MLCSVQIRLYSIFTKWKKFSIGLHYIGFWVELETFEHQYQTYHSSLSKNSDWGLHLAGIISPVGCCYFQKHFQNVLSQSLQKIVLSTALHIAHAELLHDHGQWLLFHHFTPRALFFFSFYDAFQCQTLRFFTPCHCSSWSGLVTWLSFVSPWGSIKIEPNVISLKVPWRNTFYLSSKKQSCFGIMHLHQAFLLWL